MPVRSQLRFVIFLLLLATFTVQTAAQTWTQLFPTGGPPTARGSHRAVYDAENNRMIVFGGRTGSTNLNDVWVLTNANGMGGTPQWIQLNPSGALPSPRWVHGVGYDSENNILIVFGGAQGSSGPCANDTWILTNANGLGGTPTWTQLGPGGSVPGVRFNFIFQYAEDSNRLIVAGGSDCFGWPYRDAYVLANASGQGGGPFWTNLAPSGAFPLGVGVPFRGNSIYDPSTDRLVMWGSNIPANQLLVLTNASGLGGPASWVTLNLATAPTSNAAVPGHSGYNLSANRGIFFGGFGPAGLSNETWRLHNASALDGSQSWALVTPTGTLPPARGDGHTVVYDAENDKLILFGGNGNAGPLNDVWVLSEAAGVPTNQAPTANAGADQTVECTSDTGTSVTLDGSGSSDPDDDTLTYTWRDAANNVVGTDASIIVSLPLGMHTFTLTVDDGKGGTATDTVSVTVQDTTAPSLTLASSSVTVVVPTGAATGEVVDVLTSSGAAATDACDPNPALSHNGPAGGFFPIGETVVTITATDDSGNFSTAQFTVRVVYNFIGFLPPIHNDGSSIFKSGRVIPVKFQLTAADGSFVTNASATLAVFKVTDDVLGSVEVESAGDSNTDTAFRFDPASNQYIFNLSTKGYSTGSYLLRVLLNDGTQHEVIVSVK